MKTAFTVYSEFAVYILTFGSMHKHFSFHAITSRRSSPPIFNEGDDHEEWKTDVKMWHLISDVPKDLHTVSVHVSLTERAKNATSEVP